MPDNYSTVCVVNNTNPLIPTESALRRGIKAVGIGKKGSRSLNRDLALEIFAELQQGQFKEAEIAAFFAALFIKGPTADEILLADYFPTGTFADAAKLTHALCNDAPADIKDICVKLLQQKDLNKGDAYTLGKFLLSPQKGDGARGLASIVLRVRYETTEEYLSLLQAATETIHHAFRGSVPKGQPIIQISEPFDGVDHNYMITPCLSQSLQTHYRVISLVGRNSGPKDGNNLYDLAQKLGLTFLTNNSLLTEQKPYGGFYIDQKDLSPILDRWVDLRHEIIKRPFLATLEKFLDPCKADIIITSAFHGAYGEKMADIAEGSGFKGSIVVRNGVEGSIAFPLTRPAKILCSARQSNGQYLRKEFIFDAAQFFGTEMPFEQKLDNPSLDINATLVKEFLENGQTSNNEFDRRIAVTCDGIRQAAEWILNH
ncbi:MAG: anthranilate phosphoribosyltransferase [Candidatus Omnitrophica bacterium]|nr:anthranilate phosphoribosyltransferase [Candidatus Omnitrophota bacterium]